MTLEALSREYQISGQACKQRVRELEAALREPGVTETQRLILRRRITVLTGMARDAIATGRYLQNYYKREGSV